MGGIRRVATTAGLLILALLPCLGFARHSLAVVEWPVAAATPDAAPARVVPVALAEPIAAIPLIPSMSGRLLPEPGRLLLVGTGLMGLAAIVRRRTRS